VIAPIRLLRPVSHRHPPDRPSLDLSAPAALSAPSGSALEPLAAVARERGSVRVLVEYRREGWDDAAAREALDSPGVDPLQRFATLPFFAASLDEPALLRVAALPGVVRVLEDRVEHVQGEIGESAGAGPLHRSGIRGAGQAVAVLDIGFEADHPAFAGRVLEQACFATNSSREGAKCLCRDGAARAVGPGAVSGCTGSGLRDCSHGNHVAGIVAGNYVAPDGRRGEGIAPEAGLVLVNVFSAFRDSAACQGASICTGAYTSDILRGLEWVLSQKDRFPIAAVNMSLGGDLTGVACPDDPRAGMIARLREAGTAVVVSAGNEGHFRAVSIPECKPGAIAVGSRIGSWISSFSNRGPLVRVYAPGESVLSICQGPLPCSLTGTSMAAPHVAGAFALLRQLWPEDGLDALEAALGDGARDNAVNLPLLDLSKVRASKRVGPAPTIVVPAEGNFKYGIPVRVSGSRPADGGPIDYLLEVEGWMPQRCRADADGTVSTNLQAFIWEPLQRIHATALAVEDGGWSRSLASTATALAAELDPAGPDLALSVTDLRSDCARLPCTLRMKVRVTNTGRATSPPVPLAVRFDYDITLDFQRSLTLLERTVPALKPKRSKSFTIKYRMSHSGSPTGKLLYARVDPSNAVAEASEANNRFERPFP
jgi:hypothetical protein